MKATDLMISDYLSYKGQIIKIANITKKKVGYHIKDNECRMHYTRLCDCKPIPLTAEILEKNGFENGKLNISPQYYLEYNNVFIGVTLKDIPDKHKGIDIAKGKLCFQYDISYIKGPIYIHQFQHALRLCGITREITI